MLQTTAKCVPPYSLHLALGLYILSVQRSESWVRSSEETATTTFDLQLLSSYWGQRASHAKCYVQFKVVFLLLLQIKGDYPVSGKLHCLSHRKHVWKVSICGKTVCMWVYKMNCCPDQLQLHCLYSLTCLIFTYSVAQFSQRGLVRMFPTWIYQHPPLILKFCKLFFLIHWLWHLAAKAALTIWIMNLSSHCLASWTVQYGKEVLSPSSSIVFKSRGGTWRLSNCQVI